MKILGFAKSAHLGLFCGNFHSDFLNSSASCGHISSRKLVWRASGHSALLGLVEKWQQGPFGQSGLHVRCSTKNMHLFLWDGGSIRKTMIVTCQAELCNTIGIGIGIAILLGIGIGIGASIPKSSVLVLVLILQYLFRYW